MDDKDFQVLELKAMICPQQSRWPAPNVEVSRNANDTFTMRGGVWPKLHAVVDEARDRMSKAWIAMDETDADKDLSNEGQVRKKKRLAVDAIGGFQKSQTLQNAIDLVDRQLAKWAEEAGVAIKPPSNFAEAMMQAEIRAHLAAMKGSKMDFLAARATDPRVASAILGAPPFLSGLTDAEIGVVKTRVEKHVAPEVVNERNATLKALEQAEAGWETAMRKIASRAGLTKGLDGTLVDLSKSEAA